MILDVHVCRKRSLVSILLQASYHPDLSPPQWVVLSDRPCGLPYIVLPITDDTQLTEPVYNFTVCLHQPLFGKVDVHRLVGWIVVNKVLGADRFVIYNHSATADIHKYIQYFIDEGLVEYLQWPLYIYQYSLEDHRGQKALVNDCIYRSMYKSRYVVLLDFDEFPVPYKHDSWLQLMEDSSNPCVNQSATLFRNNFFPLKFLGSISTHHVEENNTLPLTPLSTMMAEKSSHPCHDRSKMIIKPQEIIALSVHFVTKGRQTSQQPNCCLSPEYGILHHYREWATQPGSVTMKTRMLYFQERILQEWNRIHSSKYWHM